MAALSREMGEGRRRDYRYGRGGREHMVGKRDKGEERRRDGAVIPTAILA